MNPFTEMGNRRCRSLRKTSRYAKFQPSEKGSIEDYTAFVLRKEIWIYKRIGRFLLTTGKFSSLVSIVGWLCGFN